MRLNPLAPVTHLITFTVKNKGNNVFYFLFSSFFFFPLSLLPSLMETLDSWSSRKTKNQFQSYENFRADYKALKLWPLMISFKLIGGIVQLAWNIIKWESRWICGTSWRNGLISGGWICSSISSGRLRESWTG